MYKAAVVTLIALIVLVIVGVIFATNKIDSVSDSKKDTEAADVTEEAETKPSPSQRLSEPEASPTIEVEPTDVPQEDNAKPSENTPQGTQPCKINPDCDLLTEYCLRTNCTDATGVCATKPTSCPEVLSPVCSCDGKTYSSACSAKESGASIARTGTCSS